MKFIPKIKRSHLITAVFVVLILSIVGWSVFVFWLPGYLESSVLPDLARQTGIDTFSCDIRRIGGSGTDIGSIELGGDPQNPAISIQTIKTDYTLSGLLERRVDKVTLDGVTVNAVFKHGALTLPGLDIKKLVSQGGNASAGTQANEPKAKPYSVDLIEIENAELRLKWNSIDYFLPFECKVFNKKRDWSRLDIEAQFFPRGCAVNLQAQFEKDSFTLTVKVNSGSIQLGRFADFLPLFRVLEEARGNLTFTSELELSLKPFSIKKASVAFSLDDYKLALGKLIFSDKELVEGRFDISGDKGTLSVKGLKASAPLPFKLANTFSFSGLSQGNIKVEGKLTCDIPAVRKKDFPLEISSYSQDIKYDFSFSKEHKWALNFRTEYSFSPLILKKNGDALRISPPNLSFSSEGKAGALEQFEFKASLPEIKFQKSSGSELLKVRIPEIAASARRKGDKDLKLDFMMKKSSASVKELPLKLADFSVSVVLDPETYQLKDKVGISLKGLDVRELKDVITFDADLAHKDGAINLDGKLTTRLIKDFKLLLNGRFANSSDKQEQFIKFSIPEYQISKLEPGRLHKKGEGIKLSGLFSLNGCVHLNNISASSLAVKLKDAAVKLPDGKLDVEKLELDIFFKNLFTLKTPPRQILTFGSIKNDHFEFKNGKVKFQIDSLKDFFMERSSVEWCGGHIYAPSIRIKPGVNEYDVTLFCDEISAKELFEFLGYGSIKGDSALNGRIPVSYKKGKLFFDNGYLYTTPGKKGLLRFSGLDFLTAGIPQKTPQYHQMELTRMALENFKYDWIKVSFNSSGDDLRIKTSIFGKPARKLPFVYNKEWGNYQKVSAGISIDFKEPFLIDFNKTLPINTMLHYGMGINEIIKKLKGGSQ